MELAASIEPYLCPTAAFLMKEDNEFYRSCQTEYEASQHANTFSLMWNMSILNPKNRIDNLELPEQQSWRIDG